MTGIGIPELIILLFLLLLGIPWIIAFIDILRSDFRDNNKLIWLLAVIFVPFIGLIAYFFIGRKQKIKEKIE
jgi:4-amino-4-deoxy-L-arabinose transferase-like glycosyltransferase